MCGIFGSINFDLNKDTVDRILNYLSHRGPDSRGFFIDENVCFCHTRLAIQDLSKDANQPMFSNDNKYSIIYNGEIYNLNELKNELIKRNYSFRTTSDTEIILNLYICFGENFLEKLNGIFAFAIFDKIKNEVLVARDRFGVKPLYYSKYHNKIAFSSEMKPLFLLNDFKKELNHKIVKNYLTYLWSPTNETLIHNIKKLDSGSAITLKNGDIIKEWKFYKHSFIKNKSNYKENEIQEIIKNTIDKSVKNQLISDAPLGAFLSGGLDSSLIVALAKKYTSKNNFETFTIKSLSDNGNIEGNVDDLPFAQKSSELLNVNLNTVEAGPDIFKNLFKMIYYLEEPVADPAPLNVMAISKKAKEKNIKVLLSGTGGDDLFSGYRRHQALMGDSYWSWLPQNIRSAIASLSKQVPNKNNFLRRINKYFQYADLNDHDRIISYFYWINPEYLREIFNPKIQNYVNEYDVSKPMQETLNEIPRNTNKLDKMLYLEMRHFLTNHNLIYNDKMGMSEGVEIRVPFLDNYLVELINSLEVYFKQKKGQNKWILKKILAEFLPNNIVYRKKTGFNLPLRNWIKNDFKEIVGDLLSEETIRKRGFFNFKSVNKMIKLNNDNKIDATYTIFSLLCFEIWFMTFLDNKTPSQIN